MGTRIDMEPIHSSRVREVNAKMDSNVLSIRISSVDAYAHGQLELDLQSN